MKRRGMNNRVVTSGDDQRRDGHLVEVSVDLSPSVVVLSIGKTVKRRRDHVVEGLAQLGTLGLGVPTLAALTASAGMDRRDGPPRREPQLPGCIEDCRVALPEATGVS